MRDAGAEAIVLVANSSDDLIAVRSMAELANEQRLPIISHWGITGGDFHARAQQYLPGVELSFLQTYTFLAPTHKDKSIAVLAAYCKPFKG